MNSAERARKTELRVLVVNLERVLTLVPEEMLTDFWTGRNTTVEVMNKMAGVVQLIDDIIKTLEKIVGVSEHFPRKSEYAKLNKIQQATFEELNYLKSIYDPSTKTTMGDIDMVKEVVLSLKIHISRFLE